MPWPARPEHPPGAASRRSIQVGSASFVITDLLDVKDIPQVEPLRRGRIMRISAPILTSAIVSTVSIVCTLKCPFQSGRRMFWTRAISIVADAADGADDADGVMQLVLVYGRYRDCARSEPPLAAKGNFNPNCAEERLCPAQPAG